MQLNVLNWILKYCILCTYLLKCAIKSSQMDFKVLRVYTLYLSKCALQVLKLILKYYILCTYRNVQLKVLGC